MLKTNNQTGRNLATVIGLYIIVKAVINMILGDSFGNIIFAVVEALALYTGLMYINYVVAVLLALVFVLNLKNNITNIGDNWFYLVEGVIDVFCAFALFRNKDIKGHFTNKWTEIKSLIGK